MSEIMLEALRELNKKPSKIDEAQDRRKISESRDLNEEVNPDDLSKLFSVEGNLVTLKGNAYDAVKYANAARDLDLEDSGDFTDGVLATILEDLPTDAEEAELRFDERTEEALADAAMDYWEEHWQDDVESDSISVQDCIDYLNGDEEAGNILYSWLDAEDNLYGDVEDKDILDLCDAATDAEEKTKVLMALKGWTENDIKEKAFACAKKLLSNQDFVQSLLDDAEGDAEYLMECLADYIHDDLYDEGIDLDYDLFHDWFKGKTLKDFGVNEALGELNKKPAIHEGADIDLFAHEVYEYGYSESWENKVLSPVLDKHDNWENEGGDAGDEAYILITDDKGHQAELLYETDNLCHLDEAELERLIIRRLEA